MFGFETETLRESKRRSEAESAVNGAPRAHPPRGGPWLRGIMGISPPEPNRFRSVASDAKLASQSQQPRPKTGG